MKIPMKINHGDEIRIIAPSRSIKILSEDGIELAKKRLEDLGFKVTFGRYVEVCDFYKTHLLSNNGLKICMKLLQIKM